MKIMNYVIGLVCALLLSYAMAGGVDQNTPHSTSKISIDKTI